MNMFANHGFIARDGVTSLEEVVDASQNVFNMAWDLANVIALVALVLGDGDVISRKFSIGCDATSRTAAVPLIAGSQPGLNGHNNFEADASMGRNDYYLNEGDNYSLNGTKFGMMVEATEGMFNISGLSRYRYQRWHQSVRLSKHIYLLLNYANVVHSTKRTQTSSSDRPDFFCTEMLLSCLSSTPTARRTTSLMSRPSQLSSVLTRTKTAPGTTAMMRLFPRATSTVSRLTVWSTR